MVSIYELKLGAEKLEILKALSAEIEKAIASIGKIDNSRLNAIYNDILEKANQVLQDKNLVQELKDKVDVAHKDISEKAAAINQKFEQQQALLQSMQKLKAEIEGILKSGVINDTSEKTTTTYSSKKIGELLKLKTDTTDFDDLKSIVGNKLGKNDKAADSAKLGGAAADKYMKIDKYNPTAASSPNTLALRDENGDFKAHRVTAGNFLTTEKAQDDAIDENSEICYRAAQSSEAEPKQMRFATIKKMKTALEVDQKLGKNDKAADSAKLGGIAADQYAKKEESAASVFVGAIIASARASAPEGFLLCDGSALSRTSYSTLFEAIGTAYGTGDGSSTFNIPDLRGEFIRGTDGGRGVDAGRTLGSAQGDAIRNITGATARAGLLFSYFFSTQGCIYAISNQGGSVSAGGDNKINSIGFDASRVVPTANENRPRNVAVNFYIKY